MSTVIQTSWYLDEHKNVIQRPFWKKEGEHVEKMSKTMKENVAPSHQCSGNLDSGLSISYQDKCDLRWAVNHYDKAFWYQFIVDKVLSIFIFANPANVKYWSRYHEE